LEGIDFDAFFDSENFTHTEAFVESYLKQKQTKTSKLRDLHLYRTVGKTGNFYD
jgi:hypothetical protein